MGTTECYADVVLAEMYSRMTTTTKTLTVEPDSDVARVLQEAADTPLVVAASGARYRVVRELPDPFTDYDPEDVYEALRRSAGAFAGLDAAAFKAEIQEQRSQDSQGRPA